MKILFVCIHRRYGNGITSGPNRRKSTVARILKNNTLKRCHFKPLYRSIVNSGSGFPFSTSSDVTKHQIAFYLKLIQHNFQKFLRRTCGYSHLHLSFKDVQNIKKPRHRFNFIYKLFDKQLIPNLQSFFGEISSSRSSAKTVMASNGFLPIIFHRFHPLPLYQIFEPLFFPLQNTVAPYQSSIHPYQK